MQYILTVIDADHVSIAVKLLRLELGEIWRRP